MTRSFHVPGEGEGTLRFTPWAGPHLAGLRGDGSRRVGESWEFSTLAGSESRIAGVPLSQVLAGPLPFLAKLIDTAAPLSLQLHPDDGPDGRGGKEEAWIVLQADPGAHVLAGLLDPARASEFLDAAGSADPHDPRGFDPGAYVRAIPVRRGSCILVPAGTIHSIGPGILLAEIQQPSDCTLRLWDFGRARALDLSAAGTALRPTAQPLVWHPEEAVTVLRGRHVELRPLRGPAQVTQVERATLVVAVDGGITTRDTEGSTRLLPADLRLWHGEGTLTLDPGALVVLGTVT